MTTKNNILAGYKDSAVGIIPQDWEVKRVKDIGKVVTGSTPPTTDASNYGNEYMFVSPADLSDRQKYIYCTKKMLSSKGYNKSRKIPKGAVLYTCIGSTIGKIGIAPCELSSNQQINAVICKNDNEYLYYVLLYRTGQIRMLAGEQAVPIINKSDFENIKLAVPPLAEQKKIAEILGIWDEAIEKQNLLIEKLELRKRALMQRLLTGKTRLPGFTEPWQKVKLGEIGKFDKGVGVPKDKITAEGCKAITYGEIYTKYDFVIKKFASYIDSNIAKSSKKISSGAILFAGSGETLEDIGKCVAFIDEDVAYAGGDIIIFTPTTEVNSLVLSYCLNSSVVNSQKRKYGQGHSVVHIYQKDLARLEFELPSLPEQKAIAEVLTTADNEIAIHRKTLDALRKQKRGLMQQLLTGKTRVKI